MRTNCTTCTLSMTCVALATWGIAFWAGTQRAEQAAVHAEKTQPLTQSTGASPNNAEALEVTLSQNNAATRTLEMLRYLNACETEEHFHAAIEFIQTSADKSEKNRYLAEAFAAWLRKDPQAALAAVRRVESLRHNSSRVADSFYDWAAKSPAAAAELIGATLDGRQNDPSAMPTFLDGIDPPIFILSIVAGLSQSEPLLAANTLSQSADSYIRTDSMEVLYQNWHPADPTTALAWAADIADQDTRRLTLSIAATKAGQLDATEPGLAWAMNLPDAEDKQIALRALTDQWSQRRSAQAFEWTQQLADETLKLYLMPQVLGNFARIDPGAAADWLNQYDASPQIDASVAAYVKAIQHLNPAAALASAEAITDPDLREKIIQQISDQQ